MNLKEVEEYKKKRFVGRNGRLLEEWETIANRFLDNDEIGITIRERNGDGLPVVYEVQYKIRSFCGIKPRSQGDLEEPLFADEFFMRINIGNNYPCCDGNLDIRFLARDVLGNEIPHPFHPNILFYGDAGKVCVRALAQGTYTDLAVYIDKVTWYLKYEQYHALPQPPYPIDEKVAAWVINQAEPQGWIENLKNNNWSKQ
jgi:hypothetical protein